MEEASEERIVDVPAKNRPDSIALLFLTVGEIRNSKIWAAWLRSVNPELYSIYVHAKVSPRFSDFSNMLIPINTPQNPKEVVHPLFANRQIKTVKTKWGDISLVEAHLELLKAALKNKNNRFRAPRPPSSIHDPCARMKHT